MLLSRVRLVSEVTGLCKHCVSTDNTKALAAMKRTGVLINLGRGASLDKDALVRGEPASQACAWSLLRLPELGKPSYLDPASQPAAIHTTSQPAAIRTSHASTRCKQQLVVVRTARSACSAEGGYAMLSSSRARNRCAASELPASA